MQVVQAGIALSLRWAHLVTTRHYLLTSLPRILLYLFCDRVVVKAIGFSTLSDPSSRDRDEIPLDELPLHPPAPAPLGARPRGLNLNSNSYLRAARVLFSLSFVESSALFSLLVCKLMNNLDEW